MLSRGRQHGGDTHESEVSLAIAITLIGLPFLGLISPSYTYQPTVGPYGSFVGHAASLLTLSRCVLSYSSPYRSR